MSVVPSFDVVPLIARRSFPRVGWLLACVPRLDTQCDWLVACPAWLVSVNRLGRRGGVPLLAWMGLAEKYGDYVDRLLSVDYFGVGVYINTRALIGFSFRCFLARACCVGGFSVLLPPPNRSRPLPP